MTFDETEPGGFSTRMSNICKLVRFFLTISATTDCFEHLFVKSSELARGRVKMTGPAFYH